MKRDFSYALSALIWISRMPDVDIGPWPAPSIWTSWTPGNSAPYRNQRKRRRLARQMGRAR